MSYSFIYIGLDLVVSVAHTKPIKLFWAIPNLSLKQNPPKIQRPEPA
jgi:hypothetical protein